MLSLLLVACAGQAALGQIYSCNGDAAGNDRLPDYMSRLKSALVRQDLGQGNLGQEYRDVVADCNCADAQFVPRGGTDRAGYDQASGRCVASNGEILWSSAAAPLTQQQMTPQQWSRVCPDFCTAEVACRQVRCQNKGWCFNYNDPQVADWDLANTDDDADWCTCDPNTFGQDCRYTKDKFDPYAILIFVGLLVAIVAITLVIHSFVLRAPYSADAITHEGTAGTITATEHALAKMPPRGGDHMPPPI